MRVVNIRKEKYDIYIGRGSIWGNPFIIGKDGDREEVIRLYKDYIYELVLYPSIIKKPKINMLAELYKLDGKVLGCYCAPLACHGDVLIKLLEKELKKGCVS